MSLAKHLAIEQAAVARSPGVEPGGRVVHQQARRVDVLGHVGQHPLDALIVDDGLAELPARLRVVQRRLQPRLDDAHRQRGDADPALVQHAHHDVEAAVLLAEQRVGRQLARRRSAARRPGMRAAPSCAPWRRATRPATPDRR